MAKKKVTSEPSDSPPEMKGEGSLRPKRDDLAGLRLVRMAISQSWVVQDKELTAQNLAAIERNPKAGIRAHIAAARTKIAMTAQNLAAIDTAIRARNAEDLVDTVAELKEWKESIEGNGNEPM
jgi:hypothetical protein